MGDKRVAGSETGRRNDSHGMSSMMEHNLRALLRERLKEKSLPKVKYAEMKYLLSIQGREG